MSEEKTKDFIIYPAIDIIDGKCVRLSQGDYNKVKVYNGDPVEVARGFQEAGAKWIHVVDLDAAKSGTPQNQDIIKKIAEKTNLSVQTGGGIRNMEILERVAGSGIRRIILGTSAVNDREFTEKAIERYGDKIAIGIDAKDGMVAVQGWTSSSGLSATELASEMKKAGAKTIIYTDISRDGMLSGTEINGLLKIISETGLDVIASGGVSCMEDVIQAKNSGAAGIIIGKAIYEGKVDLKKCLQNV